MPVVWDTTRGGLQLAIRDLLKAKLNGRITAQNAIIALKPLTYVLPPVLAGNIRLRKKIAKPLPQHLPFIAIEYIDRDITDLGTSVDFGEGDSSHNQDIHYWLTGILRDNAAAIDDEEALILASSDFVEAIIKTLRRVDAIETGAYGKADGSVVAISLISDTIHSAYSTPEGKLYTLHGSLTINYHQRVTYG